MKSRILWTAASLLMVPILLLFSCGPQAELEPSAAPTPTPTPGAATPTSAPGPGTPAPAAPAAPEKPKYGGTVNVLLPSWTDALDVAVLPGG